MAMKVMPEFPANNILAAIAVGIVSGWASCGVYETIKNVTVKIPKAEKQEEEQKDVPSALGEDDYTGKH